MLVYAPATEAIVLVAGRETDQHQIRKFLYREREHYLGLHDKDWLSQQSPERLAELYKQFHSITDDEHFRSLCETFDFDITSLNRLRRSLTDQLDEQGLTGAVYGRNPARDSSLPSL